MDSTLDLDVGLSTRDTTARDVMLPPDRYPHCTLSCTIRDAVVALSASAVKLEDGYTMVPRYVLVLDDVERRLLLLAIDRCWSDHLAELREMREDTVLLAFAVQRFQRESILTRWK